MAKEPIEEEEEDDSADEVAPLGGKVEGAAKENDSEESEEEDDGFDFSEVAAKAAKAVEDGKRRLKGLPPMGLQIGLDESNLYFSSGGGKVKAFDNKIVRHGQNRLDIKDFASGYEIAASSRRGESREIRGVAPRPQDDKKIRQREAKAHKEERLVKWFGMRKRELTHDVVKELKAIKLRGVADPKRFYKSNDSNELPKYFTFATEVGGGMAAAGERADNREITAHSGKSLLSQMIQDQKVQDFTYKTRRKVCDRTEASRNSGHGKGAPQRGKRRGGAWKKGTKRPK